MKPAITYAVSVLVTALVLAPAPGKAKDEATLTVEGWWNIEQINGDNNVGRQPYVGFSKGNGLADGLCNRYYFSYTETKGELNIISGIQTTAGCSFESLPGHPAPNINLMALERSMFNVLSGSVEYRFEGDHLVLTASDKSSLTLKHRPPAKPQPPAAPAQPPASP